MKRWGQAKREVSALWPLISQKLESGTIRQIYQELRETGQVSVCQAQFYEQINRRLQPNPTSSRSASSDLVARVVSPSTVLIPVNRNEVATASPVEAGPTATFEHDARARDLDELF
ncbi:hypothetical protein [Magnetospirillum sp. 15-1]|uniref:hypothetical protein n=1 Tax=Magnetospirillum sp. 15-1 TaxID=1979370 RepID=UPI0011425378|nr:hypothetical protein [Magnetospirillum sp. 15-1]